jgi:hypothetical protein
VYKKLHNKRIKFDSSNLSFFCKGPQKSRQVYYAVYAGIIDFLLSFMPPLGLIFVAVLALKNDVSNDEASNV